MSLAATVAGDPFFFAEGESDGVALVGSVAPGVAVGLEGGVGDSADRGVGEGEDLCFFLREGLGEDSGAGVGETFFFFLGEAEALGSGVAESSGLGGTLRFFCAGGDGDFSGVGIGFDDGVLSASSFFFGAVELLRCFRGVGVGVGTKIFLILLPNDSSACDRWAPPASTTIKRREPAIRLTRRMERENSTSAGNE
jgi:hypothetical protein